MRAGSIRYAFVYLAQCSTCARIRYAGRTMLATPGYRFVVVVVRCGTVVSWRARVSALVRSLAISLSLLFTLCTSNDDGF